MDLVVVPAVVLSFVIFVFAWPASLAVLLTLLVWALTRNRNSPIARSLHEAALPVLIGTGLFCTEILVLTFFRISNNGQQFVFEIDQTLRQTRRAIHAVSGPDLTTYLLVLALLLGVLCLFPKSKAIGRLIHAQKELAHLYLFLLALTTFTFFEARQADILAQEEYQNCVDRLAVSLSKESESAKKFIARKTVIEAVDEARKKPVPQSTQTRLVYLIKKLEPLDHMLPITESASEWAHRLLSANHLRSPISGSSIRKAFIRDLVEEVKRTIPQDMVSGTANFQSIAQKRLGGVAESQEQWHQQEYIINEQETRSEQSEQFYKQASTGLNEAMTAAVSAAVEALVPPIGGLANEWITQLIDEAIIPCFEEKIEGCSESLLSWSRDNLSTGHIRELPDEVKKYIKSFSLKVTDFLFPAFLTKNPGTNSRSIPAEGEVPADIIKEIDRRTEIAEQEIKNDRELLERIRGMNPAEERAPLENPIQRPSFEERRPELRQFPKVP